MGWKDVGLGASLRQSMIKTYLRCPRMFEFSYVKGIKSPPNLKLTVGTAVHKGVEVNYAQKLKTKKDCKKDIVLDATRDEFVAAVKRDSIKASKKDIGSAQDEAIIMGGTYHEESAPSFQPAIKPETSFKVQIPGAKRLFTGTIDLIAHYARRANALVLSDTKTTRRAYDRKRADVDLQLTAYAYAALALIKKLPKFVMFDTVVLHAKGSAISDHVVSDRNLDDLARFEETFKAVEKGIEAGIFPPTDNEQTCSWCGYNGICHKRRVWSK